jgi:transposase
MSRTRPSASLLGVTAFNRTSCSPGVSLPPQGALTATASEEDVVPASEYRFLQNQVKELQRLLGKKTMEGEILKEALEIATGPKKHLLRSLSLPKGSSQ